MERHPRRKMPDFWEAVVEISEEHRKIPERLRKLSGVPEQTFSSENLPEKHVYPDD